MLWLSILIISILVLMPKRYWLFYVILTTFGFLFFSMPVNAATDAFDLNQATIVNAPSDVASWPITTALTVDLSGNVSMNFDKKDGPNHWPDQLGGPGIAPTDTIRYTMWLFLKINNKWVGSAFLQKYDQSDSGDPISDATCNWYYGPQWAPMTGYQFKAGEKIGFMVTSGNERNGGIPPDLKERSNVVVMAAPADATDPSTCPNHSDTGGAPFPKEPTPTPPTQGSLTNLGQLIQQIFSWSLGILGIAVFVVFFYSGFLWLTAAGNTARIGEARSHMTNAIFGAILLLSSYLILYTINPDFVKNTVNLPGLGTPK